jgi:Pregnancy-associated plasma protein-A
MYEKATLGFPLPFHVDWMAPRFFNEQSIITKPNPFVFYHRRRFTIIVRSKPSTMNEKGPFFIRIYPHIIRRLDGSGGQPQSAVEEAIGYLNAAFNEHKIYFIWDCGVDYINVVNAYYDAIDPGTAVFTAAPFITPPHSNTDGIDIYFFPDHPSPIPIGAGLAEDIGGKKFYVTGNYTLPPFESRIRSHVVSHEMGHCLGLLHTHNNGSLLPTTGDEYVDQIAHPGNCLIAGDCICDTPADPNMEYSVNYPNCEWTDSDEDSDGNPYQPSTTNIMSYTHDECYEEFTVGQGKRMRNAIASHPVLMQVQEKVVITTNTTWDVNNTPGGVKIIMGTLEIEATATLTVQAGVTVRFGQHSRLIVKPGARLILRGTLTSNPCGNGCVYSNCGNTWGGVEVRGASGAAQNATNQGRFTGFAGALVENAEVAVRLWGPDKNTGSGGIISCNQVTFKNNQLGIDFFEYGSPNQNYSANFFKCSFLNDANYPHQSNFTAFASLVKVYGPRFSGCSFKNEESYTPPGGVGSIGDYGYGIFADNAKFFVEGACNQNPQPMDCQSFTHNEFKRLGYGVSVISGIQSASVAFTIKQSNFRDCYIGIFNRAVSGGTMLHNDFFMGKLPNTSLATHQLGINLTGTIATMVLQENSFSQTIGADPTVRTYGISSFNIGNANNRIRRNFFSGLHVANEAGGNCGGILAGLVYECNFNSLVKDYDFLICGGNVSSNQIRKTQIGGNITSPGQPTSPAATGNRFSNTIPLTPPDRDFSNGAGTLQVIYHHINGTQQKPDEFSGIELLVPNVENTCAVEFCEPPCKTPAQLAQIKQEYYTNRASYLTAKSAWQLAVSNGNTALAAQKLLETTLHRQDMDERSQLVYIHAVLDTLTNSLDSVRAWLARMDNYGAEMLLATDYLGSANTAAAYGILANAPTKLDLLPEQAADLVLVEDLFDAIAGLSVYELPLNAQNQLNAIAATNGEFAPNLAKNILMKNGKEFPPETCEHTPLLREEISKSLGISNKPLLLAYPNPATSTLIFELSAPLDGGEIIVTDFIGRTIWSTPIAPQAKKINWATAGLPNGIYYFQLKDGNAILEAGRIVVQH